MPFADPDPLLAALREIGPVTYDPPSKRAVVAITPDRVGRVRAALAGSDVPGIALTVEIDEWPGTELTGGDVRALADGGVAQLKVTGGGPAESALPDWFELAKASLAHGLPLRWTGRLPDTARGHARHLTPPRDDVDWRSAWRYGMLVWRRGPGFALVEDAHDPDARQQYTLDLALLQQLFGPDLDRHAPASDLDPVLLGQLADLALVAVFAGRAVWLPYRLRRWPVSTQA